MEEELLFRLVFVSLFILIAIIGGYHQGKSRQRHKTDLFAKLEGFNKPLAVIGGLGIWIFRYSMFFLHLGCFGHNC